MNCDRNSGQTRNSNTKHFSPPGAPIIRSTFPDKRMFTTVNHSGDKLSVCDSINNFFLANLLSSGKGFCISTLHLALAWSKLQKSLQARNSYKNSVLIKDFLDVREHYLILFVFISSARHSSFSIEKISLITRKRILSGW